ncbi:enolase C-terminal domain-like protein [Macrococcus equipercicus]|uniref:Enolase C-terminal domain-containing protein n=1 Tax=Macrococcus equipercicus TaxID=69967 RepID=A0A9Q9F0Z0_9STAP|nr:enolase C-terminal domain-like protein [Macrococcus equipercicus]UTH13270.1 hypothetical protein KFV11_08345 [Macrococcus equipercicus]
MKFSNLKLFRYKAPFHQPVETVKVQMAEREVLVISLDVDGTSCYAESNAFAAPWYHYETIDSTASAVRAIFAALQDKTFTDYTELGHALYRFKETPHAIALFDYIGWQYFHGCPPVTVPLGYTVHSAIPDHMSNRVKVKWTTDIVTTVSSIRRSYPDIKICIDANGSLTEADMPVIEDCLLYGIDYIEEPFSDIALYQRYSHLPLAIDESADSIETILKYTAVGVDIIIAKYSRLGGGYPVMMLKEAMPDKTIIIGGMYEFGLSKYFTAALAEQMGTIPDITPRGYYFNADYADWNEEISAGMMTMSFPAVDESRLSRIKI